MIWEIQGLVFSDVVSATKKRSAKIFEKEIRPKFFAEMDKNVLAISKRLWFTVMDELIHGKITRNITQH